MRKRTRKPHTPRALYPGCRRYDVLRVVAAQPGRFAVADLAHAIGVRVFCAGPTVQSAKRSGLLYEWDGMLHATPHATALLNVAIGA